MRGVPEPLRAATAAAHDALLEGFRRLDYSQRTVGAMVDSFRDYLPARAAASGLVPRFERLNTEADALVTTYLGILDSFPLDQAQLPQHFEAARRAYGDVGPKLSAKADELDRLLEDYEAEFTRIGRAVAHARELREQSTASTQRIATAAATLRQSEIEVPELRALLASTKQAAVLASEWVPAQGVSALEQAAARLQTLAADAEKLAAEYPQRVAKATTRRASLATVVSAVEARMERAAADMAVLRREFSLGNWNDLEGFAPQVEAALTEARTALNEFDQLVSSGADWSQPLSKLDVARAALDRAQDAVGAPGERLQQIRGFRDDPESTLKRTRFVLRDAQLLVTHAPRRGGDAVGKSLDQLAVRVDAIRSGLRGVHPNYWAALQEAERIQEAVKVQVERFRALPA